MAHLDTVTTTLKLLADQTRLRLLSILQGNELTVKEITDILSIGQSTVSTQLSQLREAELVSARKQGQFVYYRLSSWSAENSLGLLVQQVLDQVLQADWYARDQRQLADVLERRREASFEFFNTNMAQNQPSPGQTWESVAQGLIHLVRNKKIIDLGCGIGRLAAQFAQAGNYVTGIDSSSEQIASAQNIHRRFSSQNLKFICAFAEKTGLTDESQDMVLISQALHHAAKPQDVIMEAARLLTSGGALLILDLHRHGQEWIQDRFADYWLGFEPADLEQWCKRAGFCNIQISITSPDPAYPEIEPLVISAFKP